MKWIGVFLLYACRTERVELRILGAIQKLGLYRKHPMLPENLSVGVPGIETYGFSTGFEFSQSKASRKYTQPLRFPDISFAYSPLTHLVRSGCRESNPIYIHPMDTYYRYTTPRFDTSLKRILFVLTLCAQRNMHDPLRRDMRRMLRNAYRR